MKRFLLSCLAGCMAVGIVYAADQETVQKVLPAQVGVSTSIVTSASLYGYLDSINIKFDVLSTCTVTIATSDETLLTVTQSPSVAGQWYRLAYPICDSVGTTVTGLGTNGFAKALLYADKLTCTIVKTAPTGTAVTATFRIKLDDK